MRTGRLPELGWAARFLASPYVRFISGYTLVVDGANWQRRNLTNPRSCRSAARWARPPSSHDPQDAAQALPVGRCVILRKAADRGRQPVTQERSHLAGRTGWAGIDDE
jgi:hypothetical protein